MREVGQAPDLSAAELLCAALREQGIAAEAFSSTVAETFALGAPVAILVPDEQEERAREVLASLEAQPEPDLNDPPVLPDWLCETCGKAVPATLGLCWSCQTPRPENAARTAARDEFDDDDDDGEEAADARDAAPPPPPRGPDAERRALWLEFGAVLVVFGAWRILGPLLDRMLDAPSGRAWPTLRTTVWSLVLLGQAIAVLWLVRQRRTEPATAFGWARPRARDLFDGVLLLLVLLFADLLVRWWTNAGWDLPQRPPQLGRAALEGFLVLVGIVAGAAYEELLWRGYAVSRLRRLLGSTGLAIFLSAALFGLLHLRYDSFQVFSVAVSGLVYALGFVRLGRIAPVIVTHALYNVIVTGWD